MERVMEWRREYKFRWATGREVERKQDGLKGKKRKKRQHKIRGKEDERNMG